MELKDMRLFIWDFDGTLMDTYPMIIGHLRLALQEFGHDAGYEETMKLMMTTIPYAIEHYSALYGLPELKARYDVYHARELEETVELFPHVKEVLQRIRELGGINCIFTHRGKSIYTMLERAGILQEFQEIVIRGDAPFARKPAPDSVLYLMEKCGATPEETVMIGDRDCDLGSGRNAGCRALHLLTPAAPEHPVCNWQIRNFAEMLEMLK